MNIIAMIPARGGSVGVKNKNIRTVGGKPLIVHTIEAAKASRRLSRIIVSTDSPEIQKIALRHGVEAPFLRPAHLATSTACMVEIMEHVVQWLNEHEGCRTDLLVVLYPTSPLRTGAQIDESINLFTGSGMECLVSVSPQAHHPYWTLHVDEGGRLTHHFGKEKIFYRRQDMPLTYEQNGAIYIVPPENIPKLDRRSMTDHTLAYVMDRESGLNIDDEMDLLLADLLVRRRDHKGEANPSVERVLWT